MKNMCAAMAIKKANEMMIHVYGPTHEWEGWLPPRIPIVWAEHEAIVFYTDESGRSSSHEARRLLEDDDTEREPRDKMIKRCMTISAYGHDNFGENPYESWDSYIHLGPRRPTLDERKESRPQQAEGMSAVPYSCLLYTSDAADE